LAACESTLKVLDLVIKDFDKVGFLDFVVALGSLKGFHKLKHLKVPHKALILDTEIESVTELLPESLERLEIWYPTSKIHELLFDIIGHKENLPNLDIINLHCSNDRGLDFEPCYFDGPVIWGWNKMLRGSGLILACKYRCQDRVRSWRDDEHDPLHSKILSFLEDLWYVCITLRFY
jgi:hypothetical protein